MMESEIDIDAPLHYAEFRIFPSQDRYEACVCSGRKVENVASGVLGHLMLHLPAHQGLLSGGSDTVFRLKEPDNHDGLKWFTKSTLTRFLNVVGSPEVLKTVSSVGDEINQLEEARKFHLSLYTKGQAELASSDASKNELLRAMDLRLTVLRGELAASFNRAAGGSCSVEDITDLENLCQHFGALDLRNTLRKLMDLCQMVQKPTINSRKERIVETQEKSRISKDLKPSQSETTVKYGVSPAKAALAERQSSTDSEESSDSGEGLPPFERSRTLIRAASPRRAASPMRRVQIGRTGSRRAAALTIKSLNYFPGRDKTFAQEHANANSSEDETSEQPPKRSETNAVRMSVQDKISLFESKQKDQASDVQKRRSTLDAASSTSKTVLRRWSSSIEQSSSKQQTVSGCSVPMTPDDLEDGDVNPKMESNVVPEQNNPIEDANTETPERKTSYQTRGHADVLVFEDEEESDDKPADSTEWNRQKEAELNEMLAKMMESKPVRYRNKSSENNTNRDVEVKKRGGSYDNYKERRDEKLRGEAAGKGAEKQAQYRAMQKILDVRKAEMASVKPTEVVKKKTMAKTPNPRKVSPQPVNPKKESPKPMVPKKALSKGSPSPSPVPAVRKSWSSTLSAPSPRVGGTSPAKTPGGTSSAGTTPTRRKPQPVPSSVTRASPKTRSPQPQPKNTKPVQKNPNKTMTKVSSEKPLQASAKTLKTTKTKVQKSAEKDSSVVTPKPSLYSKVTKKSSVVPLESKPFLRKGSGGSPAVGSVTAKSKVLSHPEEKESLRTSGDLTQAEAIQEVSPQPEVMKTDVEAPNYCTELETERSVPSPKYEYRDSFEQSTTPIEDSFEDARESALDTETGVESTISPMAWVEEDENEEDPPLPNSESMVEITSSSNVASAPMSSPRVRHSLSQMLLEETAEPDIIEWGNAENPPAMVYQKDAPKGLKRLLKFARKSNKADTNSTGSVFSEGEDDVEESKAAGKKNPDNLLRKAALHAASNELFAVHASLNGGQNSPHMLHEHFSSSATTAKAPRSFFSLSAFRGSKPN